MEPTPTEKHIQLSFFSHESLFKDLPDAVYDVPISTEPEKLILLLNKTMQAVKDDWVDRNVELLIGDTFIRTSLEEFIEEFQIQTEVVVRVECILRMEAPSPKHDLPAPDWVSSVQIFNKNIFATTYNGEVVCWNTKGEQVIQAQRDKGASYKCGVIVNGEGLNDFSFIVGGDVLTLYESRSSQVTAKAVFRGHERSVEAVCLNSPKTRLLSGGFDNYVKIWNIEDSDEITIYEKPESEKPKKKKENFVTKTPVMTLAGHKDAVVALSWTTWNEKNAISASWDQSIIVWDLELGGEIAKIRGQKAFTDLAVNESTGLVITSSTDSVPRLYDVRSHEGTFVKQTFTGHRGWVSCLSWNPENSNMFVSGSFDNSLKMWDIRSSKTSVFDLHGHEDKVLCVDWNEHSIASGSVDTTVKVFNV
ncbi:unnamed protein product [Auanema sp. JU1783]|nr:unnamed protein product [Auanema sp. JU1783]